MNIRKIAELAGVSVATVSRVFNHPERVLPETRERVLAITEAHDYTPNWLARGLNLGTTKTIALLVPDIDSDLHRNIISGVETVADNKGFVVILSQTGGDPEAELEFMKTMKMRHVDGIIHVDSKLDVSHIPELDAMEIPRVHIGKNRDCGCDMLVYLDFEEAAYRMARHLGRLGHHVLGILSDERTSHLSLLVEPGIERASRELKVPMRTIYFSEAGNARGGYFAVQKMIQKNELPEAFVTENDLQAIGALKAARDAGLVIPDEMALACFNDSVICKVVTPAITSIEMPASKLGMTAARFLFDRLDKGESDDAITHELILQPKLKIRASCGNKSDIFELFD